MVIADSCYIGTNKVTSVEFTANDADVNGMKAFGKGTGDGKLADETLMVTVKYFSPT